MLKEKTEAGRRKTLCRDVRNERNERGVDETAGAGAGGGEEGISDSSSGARARYGEDDDEDEDAVEPRRPAPC